MGDKGNIKHSGWRQSLCWSNEFGANARESGGKRNTCSQLMSDEEELYIFFYMIKFREYITFQGLCIYASQDPIFPGAGGNSGKKFSNSKSHWLNYVLWIGDCFSLAQSPLICFPFGASLAWAVVSASCSFLGSRISRCWSWRKRSTKTKQWGNKLKFLKLVRKFC